MATVIRRTRNAAGFAGRLLAKILNSAIVGSARQEPETPWFKYPPF
jgi:hypothetical protein